MRRLWAWALGLAFGTLMAMAASADCTPLGTDQPYDASSGKFSVCPLDPDALTASCDVLLIGEDGVMGTITVTAPVSGTLQTLQVPKGVYGNGSAITDCQDANARRAAAVLYPKVQYPAAPKAGQLLLGQ